jgi:hypothetical protein
MGYAPIAWKSYIPNTNSKWSKATEITYIRRQPLGSLKGGASKIEHLYEEITI